MIEGALKVGPAAEYGREGFVVEQFSYLDALGECVWCIPGWIEDRCGESGFFETEAEAHDFILTFAVAA